MIILNKILIINIKKIELNNYQNDLFKYQISDWSKDFELRPFKYAMVKSSSDEVFL